MPKYSPINKRMHTNWHLLVPYDVATRQIAWEFRQRILRAKKAGASTKEIAKIIGVTPKRLTMFERKARADSKLSPIEQYYRAEDSALKKWQRRTPIFLATWRVVS
jgi:hypothetical protein